jgi:hypothetical protein
MSAPSVFEGRGLDLNGKRVLIVEDDYLTAQGLSHTIADYGFTVVGPVCTACSFWDTGLNPTPR